MDTKTTRVSPADIERQKGFCEKIAERLSSQPKEYLAFVDTYGCQQNEADSERLRGYLKSMGYGFTTDENAADVIEIGRAHV